MKNFIIYFGFIAFMGACGQNMVIDRNHYNTEDHVESFSEIKEAFFPDLDSTYIIDTLHIDLHSTDSLYQDSQVIELMLSRDSLGETREAVQIGRKTLYLNIHCAATIEGVDLSGKWFENFFAIDRGWDKPGYNEIVLLDGTRYILTPYNLDGYTTWNEVTYGVRGRNSVSINIAYVGGVDKKLKAKDTRTEAQKRSIDRIVYEIVCAIPDIIVQGHRDNPNVAKACPSYNVSPEYEDLRMK